MSVKPACYPEHSQVSEVITGATNLRAERSQVCLGVPCSSRIDRQEARRGGDIAGFVIIYLLPSLDAPALSLPPPTARTLSDDQASVCFPQCFCGHLSESPMGQSTSSSFSLRTLRHGTFPARGVETSPTPILSRTPVREIWVYLLSWQHLTFAGVHSSLVLWCEPGL